MSPATCSGGSTPSSHADVGPSANSTAKTGATCNDKSSGHSTKAGGAGSRAPPRQSFWQCFRLLLFGFSQRHVEQDFLAYKYQQARIRMLDACAAAYHAAVALALVAGFPATAWLHWRTLLDLLGVVLGWVVPAFMVLRVRPSLSPQSRELAVLLVDVGLALQVGVGLQWVEQGSRSAGAAHGFQRNAHQQEHECMESAAAIVYHAARCRGRTGMRSGCTHSDPCCSSFISCTKSVIIGLQSRLCLWQIAS